MIRLLVDHGAKLDALDSYGLTPLHIAILENRPLCVKLLLDLGASLDVRCFKNKEFTDPANYGLYNRTA